MTMNWEEFNASINQQDKELAESIARSTKFIVETENMLVNMALSYYTDLAVDTKQLAVALKGEAHEHLVGIANTIEHYMYYPGVIDDSKEDPESFKVPDLNDFDESEEYFKNLLEKPSSANDPEFIEELKENIKQQREEKEFKFACHRKILEFVYLHFPEVVDFTPNGIRKINFYSYCSASLYTRAFYFLIAEQE